MRRYVLTRPLGATLGDTLTRPANQAPLATAALMVVVVLLAPRLKRPAIAAGDAGS